MKGCVIGWSEEKSTKRLANKEESNNEHLELFGNEKARQAVREFFGLNPRGDVEEGNLEGSILWLHGDDAWVVTVVTHVAKSGMPQGQQQKWQADKQGEKLEVSMLQLTRNVQVLVKYWVGYGVAIGTNSAVIHVVEDQSNIERYRFVDSH